MSDIQDYDEVREELVRRHGFNPGVYRLADDGLDFWFAMDGKEYRMSIRKDSIPRSKVII